MDCVGVDPVVDEGVGVELFLDGDDEGSMSDLNFAVVVVGVLVDASDVETSSASSGV